MNTLIILSIAAGFLLTTGTCWFTRSAAGIALFQRFEVQRPRLLTISLLGLVSTAGIVATLWFGTSAKNRAPAIPEPSQLAITVPAEPLKSGDLNVLVQRLEARLERDTGDAQGWALLARTNMELQRYGAAAKAYAQATRMLPNDGLLHVEFADADYMARNQRWSPEANAALKRALALVPDHPEALWLAGRERFEQKDYVAATKLWENLAKVAPPDSDYAKEVRPSLIEARSLRDGIDPKIALAKAGIDVNIPVAASRAGDAGAAHSQNASVAPTSAASPHLQAIAGELKDTLAKMESSVVAKSATTSTARIRGIVNLDIALRNQVKGDDIVFIFAKGGHAGVPPMPLAVARHRVSDLPIRFELSDNNAMSPEAKLSSAKSVIVTARISRSGDAIARPGDLTGDSQNVALGADDIKILINKQL